MFVGIVCLCHGRVLSMHLSAFTYYIHPVKGTAKQPSELFIPHEQTHPFALCTYCTTVLNNRNYLHNYHLTLNTTYIHTMRTTPYIIKTLLLYLYSMDILL
jgi:hypothetical protein